MGVLSDPQVVQNGLIKTMQHPWALHSMRQPRAAAQFDVAPFELRRHAPLLGEHTKEVLREVGGFNDAELENLQQNKIIQEVRGRNVDASKAAKKDPRLRVPTSG